MAMLLRSSSLNESALKISKKVKNAFLQGLLFDLVIFSSVKSKKPTLVVFEAKY
jgi:hypothetical protein